MTYGMTYGSVQQRWHAVAAANSALMTRTSCTTMLVWLKTRLEEGYAFVWKTDSGVCLS